MDRKMIYPLIAITLVGMQALSCAKNAEEEAPEARPAGKLTSIEAYIVQPEDPEATKTDYVLDEVNKVAVFSWVDGDHIDAVVTKGSTVSSVVFTKQTDDTEHTNYFLDGQLSGQPTLEQRSGYTLGDLAFYPSRVSPEAQAGGFVADWSYEGGKFTLDLPASITLPARLLSVVPMVGTRDTDGKFAFTQPVGVLAVTVKNLPLEADFVSIHSDDAALAGCFDLAEAGGVRYVDARGAASDAEKTLTQHFSGLYGDQTFYFSVPAGAYPAGLEFTVGSSSNADLRMVKRIKKTITVPRGNIVKTPALEFEAVDPDWKPFGTGTFKDDFLWTYNTGFQNPTTVTVTIERSAKFPKRFRISNPYTAACTAFNYTPYTQGVESDAFFEFVVEDDGTVTYPAFRSGVEDKVSGGYPMLLNNSGSNTKVVSWQSSGDFYEIQFGVLYTKYNDASYYYTKNNPPVLHLTVNVTETWAKVVDGTFIDEKLWGLQGWGSERVNIELLQSEQFATHFRVPNPYLVAKDHFTYTPYTSGITGDDYLEFSIETGDAVRFVTFNAGIEDKASGGQAMKVWYPLDFGSGYTTAQAGNLVASYRSDGLPREVELYPIYSGVSDVTYKYTDQGTNRVRLSFPEPETWTAVSTLRFKDDFIFTNRHGKPADSNVEVTLEQSNVDAGRFRIANPYPALCDALGVTKYTTDVSEYIVMTVDSDDKITYEEFRPGVGDSSKELMVCEPSDWNTKSGGSTITGNSRVVSYDASGYPELIMLYGVYHEVGNYKNSGESGNYLYTRDNDQYGDVMVLAPAFPLDTWTSLGNGRFWDKLVWECAGLTDYATAEFQQNVRYPNKFRIAKPYPGTDSGDWFVFDVSDPNVVTCDKYYLDYEVTALDKGTFKPYIWTGYWQNEYSKVLSTQANGLPAVVEIGPCYRKEPFESYDYEIGRNWEELAIEIIFPGCTPYMHVTAEPYQSPVIKQFHLPVAKLTFENTTGDLERMVVKITGGDFSRMSGLRLWQDNIGGWMDSGYTAPNTDGVVTITNITNGTISGSIDLNFWINDDSMIGEVFRFDIQEVVVGGSKVEVAQDKDFGHYPGARVNNGGDKVSVRGFGGITEETVNTFRIPALVTSNAGTLIAAYDVRYKHSGDLSADIDVGVKRSTDGGKTWSNLILAMDMGTYGYNPTTQAEWETAQKQNGIGDPTLLVDEETGRIFCFAVWAHGHLNDSDNRSLAYAGTGFAITDTPQFMMVYSDDDGATWSEPVNLTRQVKKNDWRMTFQGPGRGITMADGTLVIPMQHQEGENKTMHGLYPLNSGIAYSTDHGETWHMHNYAYPVTSECAVAEIQPGVLLLTMRDETDSHTRRNYITTDLGRTWTKHVSDGKLIDSTCEASILHVNAADNSLGKDLVLFCNPKNASGRSNFHIQASEDSGATWTHSLQIDAGGGNGYTCLTMVDNATVGVLYESSRGHILFQAIPLTEIVK